MPTHKQYEKVKKQISTFKELGMNTLFEMQPMAQDAAPKIIIDGYYRLSDPNWDIVSKQLTQLYKTLKRKLANENR